MTKIKIFSLNCLGVPFATNHKVRFKLIPAAIKEFDPDFVMLEEIGDSSYFQKIRKAMGNSYHFYPEKVNFINRSGTLVFLSKNPLISYSFLPYSASGGPYLPFSIAEFISRKGIQICSAQISRKKIILLHTHLAASYFNKPKEYIFIAKQLEELIRLINSIPKSKIVILGGDLNFSTNNPLYPKLLNEAKLHDPLKGKGVFTSTRNNLNVTSFIRLFKWADKKEDFVLTRGIVPEKIKQVIRDDKITYQGRIYNLSDHYALETTITLE